MRKIVIIGNRGVGKSFIFKKIFRVFSKDSLFNLATPDVNYSELTFNFEGVDCLLVDTFPFPFFSNQNDLIVQNKQQVFSELIENADLIIWIVNSSFNFQDEVLIQNYLEKNRKNYSIIFNSDSNLLEYEHDHHSSKLLRKGIRYHFFNRSSTDDFHSFVSFLKNLLLDFCVKVEGEKNELLIQQKTPLKLTIFGPPNSGKSTLLNSIVRRKRSVTSPIAGTTKEPVITFFSKNQITFELIDTEGVTNDKRNHRLILKGSDVAIVVIDVSLPITKSVLQITSLAEKCEKVLIIVFNKIDLVKQKELSEKENEIKSRLKSSSFSPVVFLSAIKKQNLSSFFNIINEIVLQSQFSFSKSVVSKTFEELTNKNLPSNSGKLLKVYYAIHLKGFVHKFIVFVNNKNYVHFSYERYVKNFLRKKFNITLLPIRIFFKNS